MLEQFVKGWGIYYVIAALCLLGAAAKLHEGRVYRRLLRAAQEPERTDQPFMKQIRLKYKSYFRLEHRVHNIDAFIENHLFRYKTHGIGLERLHGISSSMMLLCVMASCIGVGVCVGNDMGSQCLMYHVVAGAAAVAMLEWVDVQSASDSRRRMLITALKDYLENVLANSLEHEPAGELPAGNKTGEDKPERKTGEDKPAEKLGRKNRQKDTKEIAAAREAGETGRAAEAARLEEAIAQATAESAAKRLSTAQEKIITDVIKEFFP